MHKPFRIFLNPWDTIIYEIFPNYISHSVPPHPVMTQKHTFRRKEIYTNLVCLCAMLDLIIFKYISWRVLLFFIITLNFTHLSKLNLEFIKKKLKTSSLVTTLDISHLWRSCGYKDLKKKWMTRYPRRYSVQMLPFNFLSKSRIHISLNPIDYLFSPLFV